MLNKINKLYFFCRKKVDNYIINGKIIIDLSIKSKQRLKTTLINKY